MELTEVFTLLGISWFTLGAIIALHKSSRAKVTQGVEATIAYSTGYGLADDNIRLYYAMYGMLPSKPWMRKASLSILDTRDKMLAFNASKE